MSDSARPKSGGDKLDADEVNADLPIIVNAGETINGATLPVALYMDDADNEVKACDADDQTKLEFIGFGISNAVDGGAITYQHHGIVDGFSSLDIGKPYYVQDDKTIGPNIGTFEVRVGIAVSATQILILPGEFEFMGTAAISANNFAGSGSPSSITDPVTVPTETRMFLINVTGTNKTNSVDHDLQVELNVTKKGKTSASIAGTTNEGGAGTFGIIVSASLSGTTMTMVASGPAAVDGTRGYGIVGTIYLFR